jgi:putative DNA primase/helicase
MMAEVQINPTGNTVADEDVIARLAALTPMEYDRARREEAKALAIQVRTLDDLVKAARNQDTESDRRPFPEVEPWPDPIDPALLFDEMAEIILRFIVLDRDQADAATLWVAHTYLVDVADISPILIINAPEKACAKTLLQTLVGRMSYRPLPASNATLSALFRAVEVWKPTILIDEGDTFLRDHADLHGMLNSGYMRGGFVLRSEAVGDSFEPRMFSVYCAKSIAGIALERHLPDSTWSRGIVLNLRRKLPHESVHRLRYADSGLFERIAAMLTRFADDHAQQVRLARPHLPENLNDRAQDCWEALLAIAECAGPEWVERATAAALRLSSASEQSTSTGNELLADIRDIIKGKRGPRISTADLIAALIRDTEKSWGTYNRGKPISPRQLAKQLSAYGIKPKTVRLGHDNTPKGYELSEFKDAFARYLPPAAKEPPQRNVPLDTNHRVDGIVVDQAQPACVALSEESIAGDPTQVGEDVDVPHDPLWDTDDPELIADLMHFDQDVLSRRARRAGGDSEAAAVDEF